MQILSMGDFSVTLTTKESDLLTLLYKNKNNILDRHHALKAIWGDDNYFNGRSMDVYIAKLRKYLKQDDQIQIINVHGCLHCWNFWWSSYLCVDGLSSCRP